MPVSVKSKLNIKWIISIHMPLAFLGIDFNFQRLEIASSPCWGLRIFTRYHGSRFSLFFLIYHSVFVCRKESNSTTNLWIWGIWYMGLVLFVIYQWFEIKGSFSQLSLSFNSTTKTMILNIRKNSNSVNLPLEGIKCWRVKTTRYLMVSLIPRDWNSLRKSLSNIRRQAHVKNDQRHKTGTNYH